MGVILNNLIPIIGSSIAMSIPLVLASVGGAFSVRSGIMALGLESMMMMGAFFGVLGSYFTGSVLFGFLLGMVGGMVIGLFHGILVLRRFDNEKQLSLLYDLTRCIGHLLQISVYTSHQIDGL